MLLEPTKKNFSWGTQEKEFPLQWKMGKIQKNKWGNWVGVWGKVGHFRISLMGKPWAPQPPGP